MELYDTIITTKPYPYYPNGIKGTIIAIFPDKYFIETKSGTVFVVEKHIVRHYLE